MQYLKIAFEMSKIKNLNKRKKVVFQKNVKQTSNTNIKMLNSNLNNVIYNKLNLKRK